MENTGCKFPNVSYSEKMFFDISNMSIFHIKYIVFLSFCISGRKKVLPDPKSLQKTGSKIAKNALRIQSNPASRFLGAIP